jgi:hypothetical protein
MFFENIPDTSAKQFVIWIGGKGNHLHHITKFLIDLGISYDTHYEMIKRIKRNGDGF